MTAGAERGLRPVWPESRPAELQGADVAPSCVQSGGTLKEHDGVGPILSRPCEAVAELFGH